ncbi:MAG: hypothetical protein ACQEP1_06445 [Nanobdellota archaeon]
MASPKIIEEKPITMAELKVELGRIKKRDEELNFRANKTEDYLKRLTKLSKKKSEDLYKKISELEIPRLKDKHIKKIIDIMPTTKDDVKVVLEAYPITISQDNLKKIASVVKEFS